MPLKILVDCAGSATAISVIKGLKAQTKYDCEIYTMDVDPTCAGRYLSDKFFTIPKHNDPNSIGYIMKICKEENIDILIPIFDLWLPQLATHKNAFKEIGTTVIISEDTVIQNCTDKLQTYLLFLENDIPTPKTQANSLQTLDYPVFVKPRHFGRASLNTAKIHNDLEFKLFTDGSDNWIVQEFIEGTEFTIDGFNSLDGTKCLGNVVRKRIEVKNGLAVKSEIIIDKILSDLCKKISIAFGLAGPYCIQCIVDKNTQIYFTEINPRFAGSSALSIAAGFNQSELILDVFNGVKITPKFEWPNYSMIRYWNEIITKDNGNAARIPCKF